MKQLVSGLLIVVAGCDHHTAATDAPPPYMLADAAAYDCGPGVTPSVRRVAYGCGLVGAPADPYCLRGVLTLSTFAPGDDRLFVLEEQGRIRILKNEQVVAEPFLDLSSDAGGPVLSGGEQGLLGLAFHPQYATDHELFVDYTTSNPDTSDTTHPYLDVIARYLTSTSDPDKADPASATVILTIPDPYSNHNGGMLEFGADGYLYASEGDGGNAGDPLGNGQNPHALLAKMLRIDVDHLSSGLAYGIPADNPFADGVAGAPEVFMIGLRNPWRWTFDPPTGDMWIGDVGQGTVEEVDVLHAGQQAGKNLGWNMYEGTSCYHPPCDPTDKVAPVMTHQHTEGWTAVIGGQVYRGSCYPMLDGWYFYTDYGYGGMLQGQLQSDGTLSESVVPGGYVKEPSSLHADARGELYETDVFGDVWRLQAGP